MLLRFFYLFGNSALSFYFECFEAKGNYEGVVKYKRLADWQRFCISMFILISLLLHVFTHTFVQYLSLHSK